MKCEHTMETMCIGSKSNYIVYINTERTLTTICFECALSQRNSQEFDPYEMNKYTLQYNLLPTTH